MKMLQLKKMRLIPFFLTGLFLTFLGSCEKDDKKASDSLDVTVNFTGTVTPEPEDVLMVVVYNSDVTEIGIEGDIEPDVQISVLLTQDMIDNGVTVNLDTIDLEQSEIYIGAFVNMDEEESPGPGDLVEFYKDVSFLDAFVNDILPTNAYGLSSIEINLNDILTLPVLDVTVNFTGNTVPEADDDIYLALFYSDLSEFDMEEDSPDNQIIYTLTSDDILNGKTFTFENIFPWETEVYVAAFVDSNGDGYPGSGELLECYDDIDFLSALAGTADADNVAGETAITINLDLTYEIE
jgi:hypothetical protein